MWFNMAFEAVSLKNVDKLKDQCKKILRLRRNRFILLLFFLFFVSKSFFYLVVKFC